jgi:hypothetical protein
MTHFTIRDVLWLTLVVALPGVNAAGCGIRFGGGGIGGSDNEDVIYYPPGPEFQNEQASEKRAADEPQNAFGPDVSRLAELSSRKDAASDRERLQIVARLAREKKWGVKGLDADDPYSPEIQAMVLGAEDKEHVAVVIHYRSLVVPGTDVQLVGLLGPEGELLDRMTCEISSRLSAANVGEVQYQVRRDTAPKSRESVLTIYLVGSKGAEISANFDCTLRHQGKATQAPLPLQSGNEKWTIDLCHCHIQDGALVVAPASRNE